MPKPKPRSKRQLTPIEEVDLFVAQTVALDKRGKPAKGLAAFAELGDQPPLVLLSLGVAATGAAMRNEKLARTGLRMLAAHSLTTAAKLIGKGLIDRTRPEDALRNGRYRLQEGDSHEGRLRSMPSGHSAGVTAAVLAATHDYPEVAGPAAGVAGAIMLAQLPAKNHFLSDVAAGATIGLASAWIARKLIPALDEVRPEPAQPRSMQP